MASRVRWASGIGYSGPQGPCIRVAHGSAGVRPPFRDAGREVRVRRCARASARHALGMTRQQVLDLYFMDARCKLIEVAAFLDRVDRATGEADFRTMAFRDALRHLASEGTGRTAAVLRTLSDPTEQPVERAPGKGAVGAWPG